MKRFIGSTLIVATSLLINSLIANATIIGFPSCIGANNCTKTITPPNPISPDPNNGILLGWDELQNITLTEDLRVDRVFDETVDFIEPDSSGTGFVIKSGTVVSSHYLQWDPGAGSSQTVQATIEFDSRIFAFITNDQKLFNSDEILGLPNFNYNNFGFRGLESGDTTNFNNELADINWTASSPGDWTRLITAFSPSVDGETTPEPISTISLLMLGTLGINSAVKRRFKKS